MKVIETTIPNANEKLYFVEFPTTSTDLQILLEDFELHPSIIIMKIKGTNLNTTKNTFT